jgi:hypothetical protein
MTHRNQFGFVWRLGRNCRNMKSNVDNQEAKKEAMDGGE